MLFLCAISFSAQAQTGVQTIDHEKDKTPDTANVTRAKDSIHTKGSIDFPIKYSSKDSIRFRVHEKKITVFGDGEIQYQDIDLKSEKIEFDMKRREVFARGNVDSVGNFYGRPNFTQASDVFDADTLKYNFDSKKGFVYGIITKQDEGYLHSEKTKILPNKEVNVKNGKFTTCDLPQPHFYVKMTKAKVIPNDKIITGPAYLVIEDVPIPAVIPFGFFPNRKGRASGIIIPTLGEEIDRGFCFKRGGVYWGINDYMDFKLLGDIYTLGSWRVNASSNYSVLYKYTGSVQLEYASLVDDEIRQDPTFNIIWSHQQAAKAHPTRSFNASVNYGSVGHSRRNARTANDYLENTIRSSISYSNTIPNSPFNMTVAATHNQKLSDSLISITLPDASLSMSSVNPFKRKTIVGKTRWYENIRLSYTGNAQNVLLDAKMDSTFYTKSTLEKFQKGVRHSIPISTNIKFLKYFSLNPNITFNDRWLYNKVEQTWDTTIVNTKTKAKGGVRYDTIPGFYNVWDYSLGVGVSTVIYGTFAYKNKVVKALRHTIKPSVSYSFKPNYGSSKYDYWSSYTDSAGDIYNYSYYSGQVYNDIPSRIKSSSIGFGLSNSLELKVRDRKDTVTQTRKISLIDDLTGTISYNFAADSMNWSYFNVSGNTSLFKRVTVRYSAQFDPYKLAKNKKGELIRVNDLMIDDYGRLWRIDNSQWSINTQFALGPINDGSQKSKNPILKDIPYFSNFSLPWDMNITYSMNLPSQYYYNAKNKLDSIDSKVIQTIGISGSVNITKGWKVAYSTGWDVKANKITYTTLNFYRDLHCWEMTFNWIPFGGMQQYNFTVKVKAGMFDDLKIDKRKTYGNVF